MAELPSGSLTFLCTEMKGRTALCERDHNTMAEVVARHIALLDAAIAALSWKEIGDLRVRMALHAREAQPDQRGDYLSAPLNRLSRLLSTEVNRVLLKLTALNTGGKLFGLLLRLLSSSWASVSGTRLMQSINDGVCSRNPAQPIFQSSERPPSCATSFSSTRGTKTPQQSDTLHMSKSYSRRKVMMPVPDECTPRCRSFQRRIAASKTARSCLSPWVQMTSSIVIQSGPFIVGVSSLYVLTHRVYSCGCSRIKTPRAYPSSAVRNSDEVSV
jgi:hypothetical protein